MKGLVSMGRVPDAFLIDVKTIRELSVEDLCARFRGDEPDEFVECEFCGTVVPLDDIEAGVAQCECPYPFDEGPPPRPVVVTKDPTKMGDES